MKPCDSTFQQCLYQLTQRLPNKPLLGDAQGWLTAAEVQNRSEALAEAMAQGGICKGDLVAVRARRTLPTAVLILALTWIGAVVVLADPRRELADVLAQCSESIPVKFLLEADGTMVRICGPAGPQTLRTDMLLERPFPARQTDSKAPAYIIFTSGSTGNSKVVVLSQYNFVNNLIDSQPLGCYQEDDIALGALPLEHVFGLVLLAGALVLGYGLYLPEKTDVPTLLHTIKCQHITRMNGVPSLYLAMAAQRAGHDLSSLRAGFIGGGPCTRAQFRRIEAELGITLIPVYGMSECIGIACADWREPQARRCDSVGRFYSMNTGRILLEDGTPAPIGAEGEICVRGPARMLGYYGTPMEEEAWLHTGDLGYVDSGGMLHISGRKKDIIIRNGINLSPGRIETALLSLPGVEAAAVVGLPHPEVGEAPWAMAVSSQGEEELLLRLSECLPKNELPLGIYVVERLPMTASGKPDKVCIREVLQTWRKA